MVNSWNRLSRQARNVLGAVTAFFLTLTAAAAAWPLIEPWAYASRGYVREHVSDENAKIRKDLGSTTAGLYDIQISIAASRRSAIDDRILSLEIEVTKSDSGEEVVKRRRQIQSLIEERNDLTETIRSLRLQRDKN